MDSASMGLDRRCALVLPGPGGNATRDSELRARKSSRLGQLSRYGRVPGARGEERADAGGSLGPGRAREGPVRETGSRTCAVLAACPHVRCQDDQKTAQSEAVARGVGETGGRIRRSTTDARGTLEDRTSVQRLRRTNQTGAIGVNRPRVSRRPERRRVGPAYGPWGRRTPKPEDARRSRSVHCRCHGCSRIPSGKVDRTRESWVDSTK